MSDEYEKDGFQIRNPQSAIENRDVRTPHSAFRNVEEWDAEALVEQLNSLVEELEQYPDTEVREKALDLVQLILELYGEALRRVMGTLDGLPLKDQILSRLLGDDVVRAVLLVHGLVPVALHDRVAAALKELRPYLLAQGCDVELVGVDDDGRAQVRLMRSGKGAPPVAVLQEELEKTLAEAAPDLAGVDIEGVAEQIEATAKAAALLGKLAAPTRGDAPQTVNLVQIKRQQSVQPAPGSTWVSVVRSIGFEEGKFKIVSHADLNLLVCKIGGDFYAYHNACAAEPRRTLDEALFENPMLTCPCHGYHYDLRRGNCLEEPGLRLASIPAKVEDDKVKVAL